MDMDEALIEIQRILYEENAHHEEMLYKSMIHAIMEHKLYASKDLTSYIEQATQYSTIYTKIYGKDAAMVYNDDFNYVKEPKLKTKDHKSWESKIPDHQRPKGVVPSAKKRRIARLKRT